MNSSFTRKQKYWICNVVAEWYLEYKNVISKNEHNLGLAAEHLKAKLTDDQFTTCTESGAKFSSDGQLVDFL